MIISALDIIFWVSLTYLLIDAAVDMIKDNTNHIKNIYKLLSKESK